jgi:hypothetical protein
LSARRHGAIDGLERLLCDHAVVTYAFHFKQLGRDNQDETRATIRMRLGRGWPDGARA